MDKNLLYFIFISTLVCSIVFIFGCEVGKNARKEELEQKLCQLKKLEYCTKKELLKTIK